MAVAECDIPLAGAIESTLRQAAAAGICADADFATNEATTLAAIDTRNAKIHVSLYPLYLSCKKAVSLGYALLGATVMNADLATIYAACPATWSPGFSPAL